MQYESFEEYYDTFDDTVYLKYFNDEGTSYSGTTAGLESKFLNEETQEDFDEDSLVDSEYYVFLAVCLDTENAKSFGEFCVYFKGEPATSIEFRFYILDSLPSKARGFGDKSQEEIDREREEEEDDDEEEPEEPEPAYDDVLSNPVAIAYASTKANDFSSVYVNEWTIGGESKGNFTLEPDQYLVMQIYNNTGYGKDAGLQSVKLTMTNLIISNN